MRVGEEKEGAGRRKQGRGAPAPPPPASFPSPITVQEQQKSGESREVQIAEGPYSVLSGGWHGGSQGAYCWEGRKPASGRPSVASVPSDSLPLRCSAEIKGLSVVRWIPGSCGRVRWSAALNPAHRTRERSRPEGGLAGSSLSQDCT